MQEGLHAAVCAAHQRKIACDFEARADLLAFASNHSSISTQFYPSNFDLLRLLHTTTTPSSHLSHETANSAQRTELPSQQLHPPRLAHWWRLCYYARTGSAIYSRCEGHGCNRDGITPRCMVALDEQGERVNGLVTACVRCGGSLASQVCKERGGGGRGMTRWV